MSPVEQKSGGFDVGSLIRRRALLAPMSGVTDLAFRRLAHRFGATLVVSEMVAAPGLVGGCAEALMRAQGVGISPHVVQLAGCEARWLGEAARIAEASGAAMVDINMGCPARRVTGGWAGSALMRNLDHAQRLVDAVVAAVRIPVSLKMRLGWDRDCLNAPDLARRAVDSGVAMITVHGRTRQQFYTGSADWAAIRRVRAVVAVPLVANGDIGSPEDAERCLAASGADGVMIGRAAVGRPWLVGQIAHALATGEALPDPDPQEKAQAMIAHYEAMLSLYGKAVGLRHARKHLAAYASHAAGAGGPDPLGARRRLVTSHDPDEVLRLLSDLHGPAIWEQAA